ncbi:MAG: hypothetical protein AAF618_03595 [Pseudomonadota bacterium]
MVQLFTVPGAVWAGDTRLDDARGSPLIALWLINPNDAVNVVIDIAYSYWRDRAVTSEAIDIAITHAHAEARARAMGDLLKADLDDDLVLSEAEIAAVELEMTGYARGLLWTGHRHADLDRDGRVDFGEMRAYAQARADQYLSQHRADMLRALMFLDMDGNGKVTVPEAEEAIGKLSAFLAAKESGGSKDL